MILVSASLFHVYILTVFRHLISRVSINVKALIGAFNYEKTLIGAFSMFGKSSRTFVWSVCTTLIQLWGLPTTARVGISLKIFSKNAKNWTYILPHSLTNELLPFMSPWNIVYISKLRRYCIRPGASGRISTSQWAFHNLARPSVCGYWAPGPCPHLHRSRIRRDSAAPTTNTIVFISLGRLGLVSGALLSGLQNRYSNSQSTRPK